MSQDLIQRLNDEADLCANDGADDISNLLNEAATALRVASGNATGWRSEFNAVALALHCLPSSFIGANDHVTRAASKSVSLAGLELHPTTIDLVARFARALGEKLAEAEAKYGYADGWTERHWQTECQQHLLDHISKGDPRDVAAYCAFMWHHGWSTAATMGATP